MTNKTRCQGFINKPLVYLLLSFIFFVAGIQTVRAQHAHDTIHFEKSGFKKHSFVLADSALNAIGIDVLLKKIESVHSTLNRINSTTSYGYNTRDIEENFADLDSSIDIIDENLSLYNTVLDVKNLQLFNVLLTDIQDRLNDWRNTLSQYNKELSGMSDQMEAFRKDQVLDKLIKDSSFRKVYAEELDDLKKDLLSAEKSNEVSLARIDQLQSNVSSEYFESVDLRNRNRDLLRKTGSKLIGKEYNYLWDFDNGDVRDKKQVNELARKSYQGQRRILGYYFRRNWSDQVWMLITGLIIFFWIYINFKRLSKYRNPESNISFEPRFIKSFPVLTTLVVLFNLAPFFDIHPPTAYVEIMQFLLVIALTVLLKMRWTKNLFRCWLAIGALYILFSFTGTLLTPGLGFRFFLLLINILSVVFGIYWIGRIKEFTNPFSGMIKIVSFMYILLNTAAVFCNLFGRLSMAKIFSVTAIFGLTQIIGLSVFIQIIMEAFTLQTIVNQLKGGITAKFNFERLQRLLRRALIILSVCIWIIVFTISLNMYGLLFKAVSNFLIKPRNIGSTSFEIGNILLFIFIIYISNLLQQGIGSLYGTTEDNWDPEIRRNGSRLAMTRLILIIVGFLIAVTASGLPLDKITIVLGALGVGIGLGLQSIVNNLVSGVILIFEQPFRIGDYIELADKRGRVLDIGIRSSKLVMEEGAEIIMPNADLLSGRVINWTLHDDNVRIDFPVNIEPGHAFEEVRQMIMEVLISNDYVWKNAQSEILLTAITDKVMTVNVLAWINNVHRIQSIKSDLLNKIYINLAAHQVKLI